MLADVETENNRKIALNASEESVHVIYYAYTHSRQLCIDSRIMLRLFRLYLGWPRGPCVCVCVCVPVCANRMP